MRERLKIIFLLFIALLLANFIYPRYYNQGIIAINQKLHWNLPTIEREFSLGLDFRGGASLEYQAQLDDVDPLVRREKMERLRLDIERRVDILGVVEPSVKIKGEDRLIVELPGAVDIAEAERIVGKTAFLEFKELVEIEVEIEKEEMVNQMEEPQEEKELAPLDDQLEGEMIEQDPLELPETMIVWQATGLTGAHLDHASAVRGGLVYVVSIRFDAEGTDLFAQITKRNIGQPLGIFLDGQLITAPEVREEIREGQAVISGEFTLEGATELAQLLNAGALPTDIKLLRGLVIPPDHGEEALNIMLFAAGIAVLLVTLFMAIFYKLPGILAVLLVFVELVFLLFLIKIIPITLNMAGIAGIVLFIGIAVDANILLFTRIKEALKQGEGLLNSIENGFRWTISSVRDGNLTTLMIAIILFFLGAGFLRGFAVTLSLGILIHLTLFFLFTKSLLSLVAKTRLGSNEKMWR